jgi:hypothetical protein
MLSPRFSRPRAMDVKATSMRASVDSPAVPRDSMRRMTPIS